METVFNSTSVGLDNFVAELMAGYNIGGPANGPPTLNEVLHGGYWVNSNVITNPAVSMAKLQKVLYNDLLSRGINFIWSQSKIWVSFANLNDDAKGTKCQADKNGWQASKYCADGGVYYLYRFNEDGNLAGHLDYPWGADKMTEPPWFLDPSVSTADTSNPFFHQPTP